MKSNDFDHVATYYDRLARFVFRGSIRRAQIEFLSQIKPKSTVLIVGGGTGWILQEAIAKQKDIEILYVEKSSKMIELAFSRFELENELNIHFIHSSLEDWNSEMAFDVVICNFFLDVFSDEKLKKHIIPKLKLLLNLHGKLMVADFQNKHNLLWQRLLLWIMHIFFGRISRLESSKLADLGSSLSLAGFVLEQEKCFYRDMIFSHVYGLKS